MASIHPHSSFSLLIVEDDDITRNTLVRMVSRKYPDCTVYSAGNGVHGLELLKQVSPDIVMTDINMPVMDGIDMIRESRLLPTKASFIVLTAYSDKRNIEKIADLGASTYLLKPLVFKELFAAIEHAVPK